MGGKEGLLKVVAFAIMMYPMGALQLPFSLCHGLQAMMAKFLWGGRKRDCKMHWKRWEKLCLPKKEERLVFRDLEAFNKALLAKQGWVIIIHLDSLVDWVIKEFFSFFDGDFLEAKIGRAPSFVWRSICWERETFPFGHKWRISNCEKVSVHNDPWLPHPSTFNPIMLSNIVITRSWKVKDFILENPRYWNKEFLDQVCGFG